MGVQIGRKTQVYIGKETTFGVKASAFIALPVTEFNFNPQIEFAKDNSAIGRIEEIKESSITKKWSEPSFSGLILDKSVGQLLLMALGVVSTNTDTPEAGVNTHTFTLKNDNTPVSYTLIFKDDNQTKMITGAILNTLELMIEDLADYSKFNVSFMGKYPEDTTESIAFAEENSFPPKFANVKLAANLAGLGAASAIDIESFKITIEKNTEINYKLGSVDPYIILNKQLGINGEATVVYEDGTYFDLFSDQVKKAIRLELENTDVTIGASTNPKLTFDLAKVNTEEYGREAGVDDKIVETFSFIAEFSISDAKIGEAVLINTQTSY